MDRERYRRRQLRRAIIGWSTVGLVVALVALVAIFGGEEEGSSPLPDVSLFSSEMSSSQYDQIHQGQEESLVLGRLRSVGVQEAEAEESGYSQLFPAPPRSSTCAFWKLSDAPDHLVRLCFSDPQGILVQKSVRAPGESSAAETTLA